MQKTDDTNGINIYKVKGWDYAGMCEVFEEGIRLARETHTPVLFHVEEITQPQGHSTSGSHERYKSPERLDWEREWDGIKKLKQWIIANMLADEEELEFDASYLAAQESKLRQAAPANRGFALALEVPTIETGSMNEQGVQLLRPLLWNYVEAILVSDSEESELSWFAPQEAQGQLDSWLS